MGEGSYLLQVFQFGWDHLQTSRIEAAGCLVGICLVSAAPDVYLFPGFICGKPIPYPNFVWMVDHLGLPSDRIFLLSPTKV